MEKEEKNRGLRLRFTFSSITNHESSALLISALRESRQKYQNVSDTKNGPESNPRHRYSIMLVTILVSNKVLSEHRGHE
jgi:hypothetical protein